VRIAILGSKGLVGESLSRTLPSVAVTLSRSEVDLTNVQELAHILKLNQIDVVINCAAYVGGIALNTSRPFDMFAFNIHLTQAVLQASINAGVNDLVQFCSNCAYPVASIQPYKEVSIFDGLSQESNRGYAASKIAALHAGQCAEKQGLIRVYHPVPCSLFGFHDNYRLSESHFVPAVIRKLHEAVISKVLRIEFWGTGKPLRELMFVDDIASAISILLQKRASYNPINIGSGTEIEIKNVVDHISRFAGFCGDVIWDNTKPDGVSRKLLDSSRINSLGWAPSFELKTSLANTYNFFRENRSRLRV